jgi:undecaprenyl-diphosphatase
MFAVLLYFWRDWFSLLRAIPRFIASRNWDDPEIKLLSALVLGTIPAALIGLLLEDQVALLFERPLIAAIMLFVTGGLLVGGEYLGELKHDLDGIRPLHGLLVGLAQAVAVIPGISRSGATIAAGRALNYRREAAARFSFMLSAPIIMGSGIIALLEYFGSSTVSDQTTALLLTGMLTSGFTAFGVIYWLLRYLQAHTTRVFAIYCVGMGLFCVIVALVR